jgi:hypothetical protein
LRVHDDEGHYFDIPRDATSRAPRGLRERRELFALHEEEFRELTPIRNVIGVHAWLAKRDLVDASVLVNPRLPLAEDVFLMAALASRTQPVFSGAATAEWHWRISQGDNWTLSHPTDEAEAYFRRWHMRANAFRFVQRNRPGAYPEREDFAQAVHGDVS